ncbi:DsbA family oxidoreductase [Falsirhodobacter halotolerans]|uniref:DsbA family oxidoreductase n=1 Tax=Falsirhodobacter halotolerans TaxID=1146892 RepID=UPI001FD2D489|nr:DsbA family oxidoreductase [Falsirhodobacter halotolerans]MCJ8139667.1 DsbA family oxidoreductase [Falsirhodobacter halotolerans]
MRVASIPLDIFSDPVCPWCFIGKANLTRALEQRPGHPFRIEWHPYQLHPDMPSEGMDRAEWFETRFGDRARAVSLAASVEAAAQDAGIIIDIAAATRMPNTLDAHRLIHWAGLEGRQMAVVDRLFKAYFQDGLDISDHDVLARIGASVGMDEGVLRRLLESEADRDDLRARDADARDKGVSAVPTFLLDRQFVLAGAQPVDQWLAILDDIAASRDAEQ